jgi:hypothetical protein
MVWSISHPIVSIFIFVYTKNHGKESILREKKSGIQYGCFCFYPSLYIVRIKIVVVWYCTMHHTTLDIQMCMSLPVLLCTVKIK